MEKEVNHKSALKQGLIVSKVEFSDEKTIIVSKEMKTYSENEKEIYINKFKELKDSNKIGRCEYTDSKWVLLQESDQGKMRTRNIEFPFEIKKDVNDILKAFTINLILNALEINTIVAQIKYIIDVIYNSNFFDTCMLETFIEYMDYLSNSKRINVKDSAMKFISFIRDRVGQDYCDYLTSIGNKINRKAREIPDYASILKFDYIINKYVNNSSEVVFFKYYPVFLWWKITSVIPMRPCEFLILKKKSFFELNGKYYIVVERVKPHGFVERVLKKRKTQTFRINKEIYDLVQKVIDNKFHNSEKLLSKKLYASYYKKYEFEEESINSYSLEMHNLAKCLKDFYTDEISKNYKFKLVKKENMDEYINTKKEELYNDCITCLNLGDSRHLAIINLVLQGTNSYVVKEMCGHRDINSHLHYVDHAKTYITSKVLVLTEIRKMELKINDENLIYVNRRNREVIKQQLNKYMKIGDNYCKRYIGKEELFPFLCLTDCSECQDKVFVDKDDRLQIVNEKINKNNSELENQLEIIVKYIKNVNIKNIIDKDKNKFFSNSNQNLEEAANKLEYLINMKANLEAEKFYYNIIE